MSSYRTYEEQVYLYQLYQEGKGNLAAVPGTSNHGWGVAVDLAEEWMRHWMDEHGAKYGWQKTEAMSEWWHINFVGGVHFETFRTLRAGDRGKRVLRYTRRLHFIRRRKGSAYLNRWYFRYKPAVADAVRAFQKSYRLTVDGEIGPKTAAKIDTVFHRQYHKRGKR
jgi:hypothetical protein